ncbi:nucleoside triphosphate pyrophosphohydrolase [Paludicola sp. MB14-C6]|uniref:nucleoside triphosphate pyrophosphohydrolase n=1 Tax=Paludihabitans sp. MB14-C6 TaxID=3070656 RepID=UPI0027DB04CA|nr:nucleoside triphosphate pyrophosphohydrolase [Paludicola sp. MB14-C6]WMJ23665.1 nucleoside triphosphate pyrophosphohydrolase [Paludicola sp. MB14-C6]
MDFTFKEKYTMDDLIDIMKILRGENGCPWDKKQNHQSIRKNFIEETYEVIEAIDNNDNDLLKEELGDVLLQVVFHAQMEQELGNFDFDDVANDICKKLIIRHPHIFSDTVVKDADEVLVNWNLIKQEQKGQIAASETLDSVPKQLPALMRSSKVQDRAKKAGFDYPSITMAFEDLKSEVNELEQAILNNDKENIAEEIGDLLFSCVNVSRFYNEDAEELLTKSCDKFINRFKQVEQIAKEQDINLQNSDIDKLIDIWKQAKKRIQEV